MTEMRRLLQAGALIAERCDDIQYFEDRYGVQAGSIANVSLIDTPMGVGMFWSGSCAFRILDHRVVPQVRDATNWSLLCWNMWDGTIGPSNFGFVNIGDNAGMRVQQSPSLDLKIRYRSVWATDGNQINTPFPVRTAGEWKLNALIANTDNSLVSYYESGSSISNVARTLNDTLAPGTWAYDGIEIGEEWDITSWRGGIYAVAVFPWSLTQDELDDIWGGNF